MLLISSTVPQKESSLCLFHLKCLIKSKSMGFVSVINNASPASSKMLTDRNIHSHSIAPFWKLVVLDIGNLPIIDSPRCMENSDLKLSSARGSPLSCRLFCWGRDRMSLFFLQVALLCLAFFRTFCTQSKVLSTDIS